MRDDTRGRFSSALSRATAVLTLLAAAPWPGASRELPAAQICPSGACVVPVAVLPDPTTTCQATSLTLTCANPATYSIMLGNGQTYTFTACGATCAGANAAFDSRIEVYQGATLVASNTSACGTSGEVVYTTDATTGAGTYCVSVIPELGLGDFTLGYRVACQAPSNLLLGPATWGATSPDCSADVTFSVNSAGTGDFTYNWTVVPPPTGSAVPTTRTITRPENGDPFPSLLTGVGTYRVSVTVSNDCGSVTADMDFELRDAAGPDITCTATQVPCPQPAPRPVQVRRRPREPVLSGGAAGDQGALTRQAAPAGAAEEPSLQRRIAASRNEIQGALLSDLTDQQARELIARKLDLVLSDVVVHDGNDPAFFREPGQDALSCPTPCTSGTLTSTHPYYDVFLACGNGAFTARTGASHSVTTTSGAPQNVIYGGAGGGPGTSDVSFHVHNNNQNYVDPPSGQACVFDPPDTPTEPNSTGIEEEWTIDPGVPGLSPLRFREEIVAFGATEASSGVRLTLGVQNPVTSTTTADVGVRWQIDYQNAGDDGPGFATVLCSPFTIGPERFTEHEFAPAEIEDFYRIQNNTSSPIFANFTSTGAITGFPDTGTPDRLVYGRWGSMSGSAWSYVTTEGDNADIDSATLVYFGYAPADGIPVAPGQSVTRSVVIFTQGTQQSCGEFIPGTGVGTTIDVCQDTCVELGAGATDNCSTASVTLTSTSLGAPLCTGNPCTVRFSSAGTYTYTWEATDVGGNSTSCDTRVNVIGGPSAVLAPIPSICEGSPVTLDATGTNGNGCTALEFQWSDAGGVVRPWDPSPTYGPFVPPGSGTWTVETRCATSPVCTSRASQTVTVTAFPIARVPQLGAVCTGGTVTIDASLSDGAGCALPLEFQFSDGTGVLQPWSTTATYPASPGATTTYTVEVRCPTNIACVSSTTTMVPVVPVPTAVAGADASVCQNASLTLDGSGSSAPGCAGGALYEWRQGATVVRPASPVATYNPPTGTLGTTVYTLVVSCGSLTSCQASDDVAVQIRNCTLAVRFDTYAAAWRGDGSGVEVTWRTLDELDTSFFVVERSASSWGPWSGVGDPVSAVGPGYPYRFVDVTAPAGTNPWYRIVEHTSGGRGDETPAFPSR